MVQKVGQFVGQGLGWDYDQRWMQEPELRQKAQEQVPNSEWVLDVCDLGAVGERKPKDVLQDFPL